MKPWLVVKFGGTSVATAARWQVIADRACRALAEHRVWIVVSALAGVSDLLERAITDAAAGRRSTAFGRARKLHDRLADELGLDDDARLPVTRLVERVDSLLRGIRLTREAPPRLRAQILATGELCSTELGIHVLRARGLTAVRVDARDLLTSSERPGDGDERRFLAARIDVEHDPARPLSLIGAHETVLTQGFIARTPAGETCLLGRGGSDTSAALFAALLGADELEIWTDVPGMFTADPRRVPVARLIRRMGYREAQELAALGAKVLHPRCLAPLRARSIPLSIHSTEDPAAEGTRVEATEEDHPTVTAVTCRNGVTLLSIASDEMWGEAGFMARVFAPFAEFGVSVDLVATSQYAITLTLDDPPGGADGPIVSRLVERLAGCGRVEVVHPCAVVSIVGRRIRAALHELGPAMAVLKERPVHLVSDSAEDLNLSFVVDQADANTLVTRLHRQLFGAQGGGPRFGPTWEMLRRDAGAHRAPPRWWAAERERLLALSRDGRARYVYHLPTIRARVRHLVERLASIDRVYYSMKANAHERVLETVAAAGCGIECVSAPELCHARRVLGPQVALLFTPNFCPLDEFELAFATGAEVVVDGPETLVAAPASFGGREIGLRIDPGRGLGHHEKVRTAGSGVKFGHPIDDVERLRVAVERCGAKVVGLHAHVGSGIFDPVAWSTTGRALARLVPAFPELRWIDLGGGLGVPENPGQPPLDLDEVERHLAGLAADLPQVELRLEPGRFLVSEAGVLLLPVTQTRQKGGINFAGVSTGMNSLIRPALYGAWHPLHNLSRLDQPAREYWHVVGPICETSDVLGRDRPLPATEPGDLLLAENAGAYGAVMASHYNLRPPAEESVIDDA